MESRFYIMRENRKVFIKLIDELSIEQLNEIPAGFNNNIAWNFAHMVVTQQGLCYGRAGLPLKLDKAIIEKFQRGTRPEGFISKEEIDFFKGKAIELINVMEKDWKAGLFKSYDSFTTSLGVDIVNNDDSIHYLSTHDQLHYGYSMALRRLVLRKSLIAS